MRIPINMGVKGRVTATLTNTKTGEKQEVKGDNLILNHYLDWAMEQGLGVLGATTFNRCYIGTSDTPPQPGDTTFVGTRLAVRGSSKLVKDLTPVEQILEEVKIIENVGVSNENSLAITPDGKILVVASEGTDFPGLRAFLVNEDYTLTLLEVGDFESLEGVQCKHLAIGGDILFVGLGVAPWGKVYKRVGDDFEFMYDVPGLTNIKKSAMSKNGSRLLIALQSLTTTNVRFYTLSPEGISAIPFTFSNAQEVKSVSISDCGNYFITVRDKTGATTGEQAIFTFDSGVITLLDLFTYSAGNYYGSVFLDSENVIFNYYRSVSGHHMVKYNVVNGTLVTTPYSQGQYNRKLVKLLDGVTLGATGRVTSFLLSPFREVVKQSLQAPGMSASEDVSIAVSSKHVFVSNVVKEQTSGVIIYSIRENVSNKQSYARQWTFPAGVGTGTVNRVGLQASSGAGENGDNRHVAQIVLPEPLEKTDLHQLDVIWEIEVENPGVWEGVIPGGSRDGSDLNWRVTINEEQFFALVSTGYSIPANWFGVTGTPNVRIGTSNEESDLIFDRENIRGEEIQYISSTAIREVNPYVPGSLKRTIRLFLEVDQGNGQIGEMVLGGSTSDNSLARITFDPPLDKPPHEGEGANPYRIYLDLEIGWQRGESNA